MFPVGDEEGQPIGQWACMRLLHAVRLLRLLLGDGVTPLLFNIFITQLGLCGGPSGWAAASMTSLYAFRSKCLTRGASAVGQRIGGLSNAAFVTSLYTGRPDVTPLLRHTSLGHVSPRPCPHAPVRRGEALLLPPPTPLHAPACARRGAVAGAQPGPWIGGGVPGCQAAAGMQGSGLGSRV